MEQVGPSGSHLSKFLGGYGDAPLRGHGWCEGITVWGRLPGVCQGWCLVLDSSPLQCPAGAPLPWPLAAGWRSVLEEAPSGLHCRGIAHLFSHMQCNYNAPQLRPLRCAPLDGPFLQRCVSGVPGPRDVWMHGLREPDGSAAYGTCFLERCVLRPRGGCLLVDAVHARGESGYTAENSP